MNKLGVSAVVLAILTFAQPQASAIIIISTDYPLGEMPANAGQASNKSQLSQLVGLYNNDVALLINPDESYSKAIKEALPDPTIEKELRDRALATSDKLTLQSLSGAVSDMVKASPENAYLILASAIAMTSDLPGKDSPANRITLARTALLAIPADDKNGTDYAARVIGVAAKDQKDSEIAQTVIALREFAVSGVPFNDQVSREIDSKIVRPVTTGDYANAGVPTDREIASTLLLDRALVAEGVLSPVMATPEFVNWARAYAVTSPVSEFSGDQGAINTGGFGGFGGSGGGAGNSSGQNPTPTPTPTPAPTPAS